MGPQSVKTKKGVKTKKISFSENAGDVTVRVDGARVQFHTDRSILVYINNAVKVSSIANDGSKPTALTEPEIGAKMPDGTIYAGVSPDTGKAMYAMPADAPLTYTFNEAQKYAKKLNAHGHKDWRVPTKDELNVLFNNRAAVGGFNVTDSNPAGWYWSASKLNSWNAWCQRFSDRDRNFGIMDDHLFVRCVRSPRTRSIT